MENLLCDEVWLTSPDALYHHNHASMQTALQKGDCLFYTTKEDSERALAVCLQKELSSLPEAGYVDHLRSSGLIMFRFRAIQWLIKTRSRLNLSFRALFDAANYLDRFLSLNQCFVWRYWMIELLSIACLSVASKYSDVFTPLLNEIQLEGLEHSFELSTIQWMELTLLQALGWCLGSTTAHSYVELLTWNISSLKPHLHEAVTARATKLLLGALSDTKFLQFRPFIVAITAIRCSLEELIPSKAEDQLAYIAQLIPQDITQVKVSTEVSSTFLDDLFRCQCIMVTRMGDPLHSTIASGKSYYYPSSPVTVLRMEPIEINDSHVDLSMFKLSTLNINLKPNKNKRKIEAVQ